MFCRGFKSVSNSLPIRHAVSRLWQRQIRMPSSGIWFRRDHVPDVSPFVFDWLVCNWVAFGGLSQQKLQERTAHDGNTLNTWRCATCTNKLMEPTCGSKGDRPQDERVREHVPPRWLLTNILCYWLFLYCLLIQHVNRLNLSMAAYIYFKMGLSVFKLDLGWFGYCGKAGGTHPYSHCI